MRVMQSLCQYVHRNNVTTQNPLGDLVQVDTLLLNLNKEIYRGFDAELGYRKSLTLFGGDQESITVRVFGTHYTTVKQLPPIAGRGWCTDSRARRSTTCRRHRTRQLPSWATRTEAADRVNRRTLYGLEEYQPPV